MSINSSSLVFPPTWPQNPRGNLKIRSLKVVPGAPNSFELKPGKAVNWVPLPEMDCKGGVVDYRPREEHRSQCFATQVIWHSRVPHCGAKPQAKDGFKLIKQDDHFQDSNIDEAYKYAKKNGYAVIEHFSLTKKNHAEYMQLLLEDVQSIQKEHHLDSLQELDNKHLPGYDGNGLRSFGGLCYGKFAGAMRSNEYVKKIFQHIYQTDQLCCSLDAPAISVKTGSPQGFTHQDMDENHDYEMWQSCFVLASPLPRIGQMVCMKPWLTAEQRSLAKQSIRNGSSMTHDLVRVNKKAVPTFRPAPKPHLHVYDDEHAKRIGDTTYIQRNEAMLPELLPTTYQGFVSDNSQTQTLNRSFSPEPLKVPEVGATYVRKERVGKPYPWIEPGYTKGHNKYNEFMQKGDRVVVDLVFVKYGKCIVRFKTENGIATDDMCSSYGRTLWHYFAELYDFHKHMEFVDPDENDKEAEPPAKRRCVVVEPKHKNDTSRAEKRMASSTTGTWEKEAVAPAEPVYLSRSYGRVAMVGLDNGWSKHQVIGPASKVQRYDKKTAETYGVPYRSITVGNFTWYHQRSHRDQQFHGYTFPNRRWGKRRRGEDVVVWYISKSTEQSHRRHVTTVNGNHSEELEANCFSV